VIDRSKDSRFRVSNIVGGMAALRPNRTRQTWTPRGAAMAKQFPGLIVGSRRTSISRSGPQSPRAEAGVAAQIPVMVDLEYFSGGPYEKLVTEKLRPGDISTHCTSISSPA